MTRSRTLALTLLAVTSVQLNAQVEITPFGGFRVFGSLPLEDADLDLPSSPYYGVMLNVPLDSGMQLELVYSRQSTVLRRVPLDATPPTDLFDIAVEYFHFGMLFAAHLGRIHPFFDVTSGFTRFVPKEAGRNDAWALSFALGGGIKTYASSRVGFQFQTRLWASWVRSRSQIFCTPGRSCLLDLDASLVSQMDFSGGLVFRF